MPHIFRHDDFYGALQLRRSLPGLTLAHRVAQCPAEEVETHTHIEAHFVLVTSGQYVSSALAASETPLPLVYNPPGTTHRDRFRDGVGSFFTLSVSPDRFEEFADGRSRKCAAFLTDRRSRALAWALLWESARRVHDSGLHLESLSLELVDAAQDADRSGPGCAGEGKSGRAQWLDRAYELLQDCHSQDLSVRELALAVGVHPVHFARTFRRHFRCTPGQLVQLRRLEKAADLLLFSAMPLADVAIACGFTDQSHMTSSFRRVYGMTPGKFRKTGRRRPSVSVPHVSFLQDIHARL